MNKKTFGFIVTIFIFWQLLIAGIILFGEKYIPSTYQYIYTEEKVVNPPLLWSRANFDGMHYLDIARKGYRVYQQAFFPLYPKLISCLTPFFLGKDLLVGWSISLVSFFGALVLLDKLVKLDYKKEIAQRTVIFLLLFPTAFFFSMVYGESLFFFLILASFYFVRTKKWWLAGIFGALASATRLAGIFLLPALLVELWQQRETQNSRRRLPVGGLWRRTAKLKIDQFNYLTIQQFSHLLAIGLVPLGLIWYMRFLQAKFHDPFMFLHIQPFFGAEGSTKIVLLYQVFWRYFKMLWTVDKLTLIYFVVVLEFLAGLVFLGLLVIAYKKKVRLSYLIFAALTYLAPTLTGTLSSMPRHVLILFPCFITMSLIKNRLVNFLLFTFYFLLLIICTILFSQGYWVA